MRHTCRLTPQFSGGALSYVPWHFISDRPLQLLVRRLAQRFFDPRCACDTQIYTGRKHCSCQVPGNPSS